jgi:hypothetical protein
MTTAYAAINDVQDTLNHEHGTSLLQVTPYNILIAHSPGSKYGQGSRPPSMRADQTGQYTGEMVGVKTWYSDATAYSWPTY